jgi:hypothetical protein
MQMARQSRKSIFHRLNFIIYVVQAHEGQENKDGSLLMGGGY